MRLRQPLVALGIFASLMLLLVLAAGSPAPDTRPALAGGFKPGNNDITNAYAIDNTLSYSDSIWTGYATVEVDEPTQCGRASMGKTIWYKFTSFVDAVPFGMEVNTFGSNFDTVLAVYTAAPLFFPIFPILGGTGAGFLSLRMVTCNDQSGGNQSKVHFSVQPGGVTYYIQVGGYLGASGVHQFHVTERPLNDDFSNGETLPTFTQRQLSTVGATFEAEALEPIAPCAPTGATVWYRFTAPQDEVIEAWASAQHDNLVAVYTGSTLGTLTNVACDAETEPNANWFAISLVRFLASAGVTYQFQVGGYSGATGSVLFQVGQFIAPPTKVSVGSATIEPGASVAVNLTADTSGLIGSYTIDVIYNSGLVTATACTPRPPGVSESHICNAGFASNTVRFTGFSTSGLSGLVSLGSITFQAGAGEGVGSLQVQVATLGDPSSIDITSGVSVNTGAVIVQAPPTATPTAMLAPPTPTPAAMVTPTPPPVATPTPPPVATPTPTPTPTPWGRLTRYMVFQFRSEDGVVSFLRHQAVEVTRPIESLSAEEEAARLAAANGDWERVAVRLKGSSGEIVYRNVLSIPRWLRGEFHDEAVLLGGGTAGVPPGLDSHIFPLETVNFVIRAPVVAATQLNLQVGSGPEQTFALPALVTAATPTPVGVGAGGGGVSGAAAGDPANRVDLLILGDGYSAAQAAQFSLDAANVAEEFFRVSPYAEYRSYVNVHTLFVASSQSGADHPTCADGAGDPLAGTFVDTAFDATYCTNGIQRLLSVDSEKALDAAAGAPDWDALVVIVNDDTYGGSGGAVSVISTHPLAIEIGHHEYGHAFTGLADEYGAPPYPSYPGCSDVDPGARDCEPNVTDQGVASLAKWAPWIVSEPSVALIEGARYQTAGMYRPGQDCAMRTLGRPFCPVASQAYVLRLYEGDWPTGAAPLFGIDLIDPGTEEPAPGEVAAQDLGGLTLSVGLLGEGDVPVSVAWSVDGVVDASAQSSSYRFVPSGPGEFEVRLDVADMTALVHPQMATSSMRSSRVWRVTVPDVPAPETPGDANCDDASNAIDSLLILQFDAGFFSTLPCEEQADVNGDGRVNAVDSALVLQFDAGLLGSLGGRGWAAWLHAGLVANP